MSTHVQHRVFELPGYPEASREYQRALESLSGPEPLRRALAYHLAVRTCWERYGAGTPELAAALYYYHQWLKPLDPKRAVDVALALVEAEKGFAGTVSGDMHGTMVNLALAFFAEKYAPRVDTAVAGEIASRFAIALQRHLGVSAGQAELNMGHAYFELRRAPLAAAWLEVGLKRTANPKRRANALRVRPRALFLAGAHEESWRAYQKALPVLRHGVPSGSEAELAIALYEYSLLLEARGEMEEAAAAILECENVEQRFDLFRDQPRTRQLTARRLEELASFQSGRSLTEFLQEHEPVEEVDSRELLPPYWRELAMGDLEGAMQLAKAQGPLHVLGCEVARLEADFDAGKMEELLDRFFAHLAEASVRPLCKPVVVPPQVVVNDGGLVNDEWLLPTAVQILAHLRHTLQARPDEELLQAYTKLDEVVTSLTLSEEPLPPSALDTLLASLHRIRQRARQVYADEPHLRTRYTADVWLADGSLQDVDIGHRSAVVSLQDLPLDIVQEELFHLDLIPGVTALYLFGDGLSDEALEKVDFADLDRLEVLDLSGNQLSELPIELTTHPTLQWLSVAANPSLELDLRSIDLPQLRYLDLHGTAVSSEVVQGLRQRYPQAQISTPR